MPRGEMFMRMNIGHMNISALSMRIKETAFFYLKSLGWYWLG